jgi:hypothetical protein
MPRRRQPIFIICPQHVKQVHGWYVSGEDGRFRYAADGGYVLDFVRCSQDGGRCMQTLCVLHRYNRRGPASWYPEKIAAVRLRGRRSPPRRDE